MTRRILHDIALDKIACVDKPCQEGAIVAIMKRDETDPQPDPVLEKLSNFIAKTLLEGDISCLRAVVHKMNGEAASLLPALRHSLVSVALDNVEPWLKKAVVASTVQQFLQAAKFDSGQVLPVLTEQLARKREFSTKQREKAAESGAAMADGSYPIKNTSDLSNAIRAIGRAKNRAAVMAHIKTRARALGATDQLPDTWKRKIERFKIMKDWSDEARAAALEARKRQHHHEEAAVVAQSKGQFARGGNHNAVASHFKGAADHFEQALEYTRPQNQQAGVQLGHASMQTAMKLERQMPAYVRPLVGLLPRVLQHAFGKKKKIERFKFSKTLPASASAADYIHDFVNSANPKFKGKSKKERIRMALGAYYSR